MVPSLEAGDHKDVSVTAEILPESPKKIKDKQRYAYMTWQKSVNASHVPLDRQDTPSKLTFSVNSRWDISYNNPGISRVLIDLIGEWILRFLATHRRNSQ